MDYEKKITEILQDKHVSEEFRDKLVSYFPELAKSEDEEIINRIKYIIEMAVPVQSSRTRLLEWLDKQRKQVSAEWSDHDSWAVNTICYILNQLKNNTLYPEDKTAEKCIEWLDNLKYRVQPKQEWSEEDKKLIDDTCHLINTLASGYGEKVTEPITFSGTQMIASIKDRLRALVDNRPQNRWKPSDEQMKALKLSTNCPSEQMSKVLFELYQDLEKL